MSLGDNGATSYQVSLSGAVGQQLQRLHAGLSDPEEIRQFAAALGVINTRLQRDPLGFGEPKYSLPHLRLSVRTAAVGRLFVKYAVHNELPVVFPLEFKLLGDQEP